jgi:hypothetical protein
MALDRTWYDTLIDDDGSGTTGSIWDKADVDSLMDAVDTEIARIDADIAAGGTTGITDDGTRVQQIAFAATQSASADANTLDDYEEESWTPTITGTGGSSGQTYSLQQGRYVKIGSHVWVSCYVALSALGTITGDVVIGGLPFAAEAGSISHYVGSVQWQSMTTAYVAMGARVELGTSVIKLSGVTAANTSLLTAVLAQANLSNSSQFIVSVGYRAAS